MINVTNMTKNLKSNEHEEYIQRKLMTIHESVFLSLSYCFFRYSFVCVFLLSCFTSLFLPLLTSFLAYVFLPLSRFTTKSDPYCSRQLFSLTTTCSILFVF